MLDITHPRTGQWGWQMFGQMGEQRESNANIQDRQSDVLSFDFRASLYVFAVLPPAPMSRSYRRRHDDGRENHFTQMSAPHVMLHKWWRDTSLSRCGSVPVLIASTKVTLAICYRLSSVHLVVAAFGSFGCEAVTVWNASRVWRECYRSARMLEVGCMNTLQESKNAQKKIKSTLFSTASAWSTRWVHGSAQTSNCCRHPTRMPRGGTQDVQEITYRRWWES